MSRNRVAFWMAMAFCAFGLFDLFVECWRIDSQRSRIVHSSAVSAQIVDCRMETHGDMDATTYEPIVAFRYVVNGRSLQSDQFYASGNPTVSRGKAANLLAPFVPGSWTTAFVPVRDPKRAFLLRSVSVEPYGGLFFDLSFVFLGSGFISSFTPTTSRASRSFWRQVGFASRR